MNYVGVKVILTAHAIAGNCVWSFDRLVACLASAVAFHFRLHVLVWSEVLSLQLSKCTCRLGLTLTYQFLVLYDWLETEKKATFS